MGNASSTIPLPPRPERRGIMEKLMNLIDRARMFAITSHESQKRRYTQEDYVNHPIRVSSIVAMVTDDDEVIAAALLHDTVEDTRASIKEIKAYFGKRISSLVEELTNDPSLKTSHSRKERKILVRERLAKASPEAQTIKLADILDNTRDIVKHDPKFADVYLRENAELIEVLDRGNKDLIKLAKEHIEFSLGQLIEDPEELTGVAS